VHEVLCQSLFQVGRGCSTSGLAGKFKGALLFDRLPAIKFEGRFVCFQPNDRIRLVSQIFGKTQNAA